MKNIFLETSYAQCGGETIPRPFPKKLKIKIEHISALIVLYSLFLLYTKIRAIDIC